VAERYPKAESFFYPAGHGFNCDQRGSYDAEAAGLAWTRTLEFLARHL
jgi:carboxymethylenebutenolidase